MADSTKRAAGKNDDEDLTKLPKAPKGGIVLDDREAAIPLYSPVCTYCEWWAPLDGRSCGAYTKKNSIPMDIWLGRNLHMTPYGGEKKDARGNPIVFSRAADAKLPPKLKKAYDAREKAQESAEK